MALKVVHLLALLILGYFGVTLEVYWILDSHSSNAAQVSGRPNGGVSNDAHTSDALGTVAKPVAAASLLRGKPKGAVEQELVKKFAKVNPVKPVEAKVGPPHSHQQNQDRNESSAPALLVEKSRRFPEYGTSEYFAMCPYMEKSALPPPSVEGCALIIHPRPDSNEGLAAWASGVVQGHLITRATGCRFMFDYGPGVAIETLITPPSQSLNNDDWSSLVSNWAIPPKFQCEREKCMDLKSETLQTKRLMSVFRHRYDKSPMHDVPEYRYSYVGISSRFNATQFDYLQSYLPGWDVRLGAACSMQLLFQPSKAIIKYQPNFYVDILPRLRDEKTLVMALYVRVGFADKAAVAEKKGTEPVEVMKGRPQKTVKALSLCSTAMEEEILATKKGRSYDQVVWLVISDSMVVKEAMSEEYGGKEIKAATKTLKREIIHTTAKGMHTRPKRGPNTIDFASAFLDFYLIGESDVVINTGGIFSFGVMASLRTARPLFTVQNAQDPECRGSDCYCRRAYDAADAFAKIYLNI